MSTTIPELLTRHEAAKALRMSLSTLDTLIAEGKIAVVQPGGRRTKVLIPSTEIERLLTPVPRRDPNALPGGGRIVPGTEPARFLPEDGGEGLAGGGRIVPGAVPARFDTDDEPWE